MVGTRLISLKNRWILPKNVKETVDLPDFVKESVPQIQILCTFQARDIGKLSLVRRACHCTLDEKNAQLGGRETRAVAAHAARSNSRERNRRRMEC